jgi:hypothetical protein
MESLNTLQKWIFINNKYDNQKTNIMKNNYYISARSNEQVQGINVNLSSEFEKGSVPSTVSFNANGSIEMKSESIYASANGSYNIENKLFNNLSSSSLPSGFVSELENKITEFFNQIKIDQSL